MLNEIKKFIIESLHLEEVIAEEIDPDAPLFGEGLGLDSIDALELGVAVQKRFGIKLDPKDPQTRIHFSSVRALTSLIEHNQKQPA